METITRKNLLYKSQVEYANFCLNHVLGCSHGCTFPCYAFLLNKRYGRIKSYKEWRKPKLVSNALEILDKEIPKYKKQIEAVHLCFTTDPFMCGYPEVTDMSLKIIEKLNAYGIKTTTLTKGVCPQELADKQKYGRENIYGITLISLDERYREKTEPFATPYTERIAALRYLHDQGLKTWVSIEPYPTPNLVQQELRDILEAVSFADRIVFGKQNYNPKVREFVNHKAFYEDCARVVIEFCKANGKVYHIKRGTCAKYDGTTDCLLKK